MKVEISITRSFVAEHSLPAIGVAERHSHPYEIQCGYTAEVDPAVGCRKTVQQLGAEVEEVIARVDGQSLNALLPVPPTAEMLASWVLARLPEEWEWATIRAYEGFACTVRRSEIPPALACDHTGG